MIRVAFVLGKVHSGGKKNLVMEYYRHIDRTKIQFDFICDKGSNSIPEEEIKKLGGRLYMITPYQNIIGNIRDLRRIFKENDYDVVHAWNSMMNVFPMIVAKYSGVTVRISESLSMANKEEAKTYIKYALRPFSSIASNYFMACGVDCGVFQFGKKAYDDGKIAIFKTVIDAKANAFDIVLRNETRVKFNWEDKVVYGFIARFLKQKNPIFVIHLFNEIQKRQSNAILVTIGFGELEEAMKKEAQKLGIFDKIFNLGRREDIKQFYNAFDAFLLPSLYEGLPVVGLESQASGLPIFFSTEITPEAAACEMAHFISLDTLVAEWAEEIIRITVSNMPNRRSYAEEIVSAGFDSKSEALRLQNFYIDAVKQQILNHKNDTL